MGSKSKLGCGGCFLLVLFLFCCVGTIGAGTVITIRNSQLYQLAVEAAQENPRAQDVLGTPIEPGWLVTNYSVNGDFDKSSGTIIVPVSGPKASGIVTLAATSKDGSDWQITTAELEVGGERFSLGR